MNQVVIITHQEIQAILDALDIVEITTGLTTTEQKIRSILTNSDSYNNPSSS